MNINLIHYSSRTIRFKLAEIIISNNLRGILTTKYPPEILETEFFAALPQNEKDFLKKYWTTFDIFKPIFEITNEIPVYQDFILYEVKSKTITNKNRKELEAPTIILSLNQKQFLDECKKLNIAIKFFLVFFLENWEVEYKEFDIDKISTKIRPNSAWNEERIRRIRASKLNQFWHDLFPNKVLYKVNEADIEREDEQQFNQYLEESAETPLRNFEKEMLAMRAKNKFELPPKFLKNISRNNSLKYKKEVNLISDYHKQLEDIRKTFPNAYKPWKREENNILKKLYSENKTISEIAQILKRQPSAISSRLEKFGFLL